MQKKHIKIEKSIFGVDMTLETGKVAQQATAAVVARVADTMVLATVVSKQAALEQDYFPLSVEYEERFYAGGKIGGSRFTRREGRPSDKAIVQGRLIDHAIRPLFPKDFMDDTQLIVTVLSSDGEQDPALVAFLAASAAFSMSGLPFNGPIVPLRIQKTAEGETISLARAHESAELDMIVSYLEDGKKVQAIEAEGHQIPENEIFEVLNRGAKASEALFGFLKEFAKEVNVPVKSYTPAWLNKDAVKPFESVALPVIEKLHKDGFTMQDPEWAEGMSALLKKIAPEHKDTYSEKQLGILLAEVQKTWVRHLVLDDKKRLDGRGFEEVRQISIEMGLLPRVHGSALFSRGATQALTVATLASPTQEQLVESMHEEEKKRYMHHYNFPPYSTGETGRVGATNRRAIGHGLLAEKALIPVLPSEEDFPYVVRLVSEILSSNGSTSMAATCGSSLALMDAGVPIKAHVAGIGIGIFVDSKAENPKLSDYLLLTDIVGMEDFAGYMDFKMTGTRTGMTAIQLELKLQGLPIELFEAIFEKSHIARMHVLDLMEKAIPAPRTELSKYAPRLEFIKIDKDQIGGVIGSGGSTIRKLSEMFGVEINIDEKDEYGLVAISGVDAEKVMNARVYIENMLKKPEVGETYEGPVTRVEDYGAFVEILPGQVGLMHVSEFNYEFIERMSDHVKVGDVLKVKVMGVENGKIQLSKKALDQKPEGTPDQQQASRPIGYMNNQTDDYHEYRDRQRRAGGNGRPGGFGNRPQRAPMRRPRNDAY